MDGLPLCLYTLCLCTEIVYTSIVCLKFSAFLSTEEQAGSESAADKVSFGSGRAYIQSRPYVSTREQGDGKTSATVAQVNVEKAQTGWSSCIYFSTKCLKCIGDLQPRTFPDGIFVNQRFHYSSCTSFLIRKRCPRKIV